MQNQQVVTAYSDPEFLLLYGRRLSGDSRWSALSFDYIAELWPPN